MAVRDIKRKITGFLVLGLFLIIIAFIYFYIKQEKYYTTKIGEEFKIRGLTWRTVSYYYHPGIYKEIYNYKNNLRIIKKAKNVGANYLLIKIFYNGTANGRLIGDDVEAEQYLKEAIDMAHKQGMKILLTPYVESRDYLNKKWSLSKEIWSDKVLRWAEFAEKNNVEMFAPGVEMNLILDEKKVGAWYKKILAEIRKTYNGKIITAEHFDIGKWKILDEAKSFIGYDCIGLTVFPRKEYNGISDIRSFKDYTNYVEKEAKVIDILSDKYNISCKLAVPMGLDYWKGSREKQPIPDAAIVAEAADIGLDIFKKHNFTGVFIAHWASEPDHFKKRKDVELMLKKHWTGVEQ